MRNSTLKLTTLLALFVMAYSCTPKQSQTVNNTVSGDGGGGSFDTGSGSGGTGGGSTPPQSNLCTNGTGSGFAPYQFDMLAAGRTSWAPGNYASGTLASQSMPTLVEASLLFKSDNDYKFIFKVKSQPIAPRGDEYCAGRSTNQAGDAYNYTKLKFTIYLRDITCSSPDPLDPAKCLVAFGLGPRYAMKNVGPIDVGSCSSVIDLGSRRNISQYGTTIEVTDVRSDSTCQSNTQNCPSEAIVRRASCWSLSMQFENDFTRDL